MPKQAVVTSEVQIRAMEVSDNMRKLHTDFTGAVVKREDADTIANINGKNLKALAIVIADQMREDGHMHMLHKMKTISG